MNQARLETLSTAARTRVVRYLNGPGRMMPLYDFHAGKRQQAIRNYITALETPNAIDDDLAYLSARLGGTPHTVADRERGICIGHLLRARDCLKAMPKPRLP